MAKKLSKIGLLLLIMILSSIHWIFGFELIIFYIGYQAIKQLRKAERRDIARINAMIAQSDFKIEKIKQNEKDAHFRAFMEDERI